MEVQRVFNGSPWSCPEVVDLDRFAEAAESIAGFIREHTSRARDNTIYWRHPVEPVGQSRPVPLGPHLYSGTLGIACFLAAAVRVLPAAEDLHSLALHALSPLRREIRQVIRDAVRSRAIEQPIGGLVGLGSLVYGLTIVGDLLGDHSLVEDAHAVSALITPERISSDESLDVMEGSAGALLALLALHERHPGRNLNGRTPLEIASECATRLLEKRCRYGSLSSVWLSQSGHPAANGFCHGMTGISTALLRLYRRTDRQELWAAAWEGFAYERNLYEPSEKNWMLDGSGAIFANSWCKGAPGLALSRVEALGISNGPVAQDEATTALETTAREPLSGTDDLCCGNAGRIDVLLHAWRKMGDSSCLAAARNLADQVLDRALRHGRYRLKLPGSGVLDLRLFNGIAGIGYVMARLSAADQVPCIAAME